MLHKDEIIIRKILNEIDYAIARLCDMSEDIFLADIDAQHGVGMAAINVGELTKHISEELRNETPEIPWRKAAGLRDVAAHSYDTIRMDDLYKTIKEDFPQFKEKLEAIYQGKR